ncbi:MAG: hypothetical protein ACI4KM_03230 [Oscillospiraceae bacterium]
MEDMKKLVERYKQELMEYSRISHPVPDKLEFPEMIDEPESAPEQNISPEELPPEQPADDILPEQPADDILPEQTGGDIQREAEPTVLPERRPQIIGYVEENHADIPMDAFKDLLGESDLAQELEDYQGYNASTTPEIAEQLTEQPESGIYPDEQLAKREFESDEELGDSAENETEPPYKSREDVQRLEQTTTPREAAPEREYSSYRQFVDETPRRGTLQFAVTTARQALPIEGARCEVSKVIGGEKHIFYTLITDRSGQTETVSLPALPSSLSQTPENNYQPYVLYDAKVTKPGFNEVIIRNLPIFEGIKSVQRVNLVPYSQIDVPQNEEISEGEPDLTEVRDA